MKNQPPHPQDMRVWGASVFRYSAFFKPLFLRSSLFLRRGSGFILGIIFSLHLWASEELLIEFDLQMPCKSFSVFFYHHFKDVDSCSKAVIFGKKSQIGELELKTYKDEFYYYFLNKDDQYSNFKDSLNILRSHFMRDLQDIKEEKPYSLTSLSTLEEVGNRIQEAKNIIVTFGAGMSGGYVPTLIEFFQSFNLEKVFSEDMATEESLTSFVSILLKDKKNTLKKVQFEWKKVQSCKIEYTPAHEALKKLCKVWQKANKNVFIYTDNIDHIDTRMGLELSLQYCEEERKMEILYPSSQILTLGTTVVLVCGQSYDFHNILSLLSAQKKNKSEIIFYSINTSPEGINIYEDLDIQKVKEGLLKTNLYKRRPLDVSLIQGSVHELLPNLYEIMIQK